jgi:hemerythrin-like domain-containing protein
MTSDTHEHTQNCWWHPLEARWVCHPATAPATVPAPPLVDVRDMVVVHTALLREIRLAPAAVDRVPAGDTRRAAAVDRHLGLVCELLHHHHEGEDEMLWPKVRARVAAPARAVLDTADAQHAGIEQSLGRLGAARTAWVATASADARETLATELGVMYRRLAEHLDFEERAVLPLAASVLTEPEWHAVGEAAVAALPKPVLPLVFGMFAYEGDPAVLKLMLSAAPAVPRFVLPKIAPRVYARRAKAVHGTARP